MQSREHIETEAGNDALLVIECGQQRRRSPVRCDHADGMRVKGEHTGQSAITPGGVHRARNDFLMTEVHPVEDPQRKVQWLAQLREVLELVTNPHARAVSSRKRPIKRPFPARIRKIGLCASVPQWHTQLHPMEATGRVIIVPTPIGNLGDITLRAIEVLRGADRIACEDTRHSLPLLAHHGISGKPLIALHEHNEARRAHELVAAAKAGETIAVISDAGMPGISDPGYRLIQACLESDTPVEVLPGPSAVITALIGSGFPCHAFRFGGFLSVKSGKRRSALASALESGETAVFFESPQRIASTLAILHEIDPAARVCVARELTKKFETYHRGTAAELLRHFETHPAKGEIVLLVHPA